MIQDVAVDVQLMGTIAHAHFLASLAPKLSSPTLSLGLKRRMLFGKAHADTRLDCKGKLGEQMQMLSALRQAEYECSEVCQAVTDCRANDRSPCRRQYSGRLLQTL